MKLRKKVKRELQRCVNEIELLKHRSSSLIPKSYVNENIQSMNRDFDLVAIAWVDKPKPEIEVVKAFDSYLRGTCYTGGIEKVGYMFSVLPGGRKNYVINLNRGGRWNGYTDDQYYLDISFTPQIKAGTLVNNNSDT